MKRQIISMAMAAVMVLSLAGCSGTNTAAAGKTADTKAEETAVSPAETESAEETAETVSESAEESEKPEFIVGFDKEFPPMGFVDENGEYTGFDLELAAEAADRMGMTFKAQPIAWDSKDMELDVRNHRLYLERLYHDGTRGRIYLDEALYGKQPGHCCKKRFRHRIRG